MTRALNRIEQRAIEARAVVPLVEAVAESIGRQEALALLCRVNEQEAYARGRLAAAALGRNDLAALAEEVASWGRGGVWEMEVLEHSATTFFFDVTRCPYYERYREMGLEEFGVCLSCCRDASFARGFNPGLRLERTTTIMQGAGRCDFRYYLSGA